MITRISEDNVVEWMAENGHPGYQREIAELQSTRDEIRAEAGRYWQECEFTQATLRKIDNAIATIRREAWDRAMDWATD